MSRSWLARRRRAARGSKCPRSSVGLSSLAAGRCTFFPRGLPSRAASAATAVPTALDSLPSADSFSRLLQLHSRMSNNKLRRLSLPPSGPALSVSNPCSSSPRHVVPVGETYSTAQIINLGSRSKAMILQQHTHVDPLLDTTDVAVGRYLLLDKTATWASLNGTKSSAKHLWCPAKSLPSSLAMR